MWRICLEPEAVDEWDMFGGGFGGEESAPEVNMSNQMVADPLFATNEQTYIIWLDRFCCDRRCPV